MRTFILVLCIFISIFFTGDILCSKGKTDPSMLLLDSIAMTGIVTHFMGIW